MLFPFEKELSTASEEGTIRSEIMSWSTVGVTLHVQLQVIVFYRMTLGLLLEQLSNALP